MDNGIQMDLREFAEIMSALSHGSGGITIIIIEQMMRWVCCIVGEWCTVIVMRLIRTWCLNCNVRYFEFNN